MVVLALAMIAVAALAGAPGTRAAPPTGAPVVVFKSNASHDLVGALAGYARLMTIPSVESGSVPKTREPKVTGKTSCPRVQCEDYRLRVPKKVKVSSSMVRVLLPSGYAKKKNARTRYPVVFLWNGARSDYTGWTYKTELLQVAAKMKAIFVMPDGGINRDAGMMSDWIDGSYDWETFHTKIVVPWVDRHFRTMKGARASVGASMGAFGVFNYAAHNPGMFRAALSISGAVDNTFMSANTITPELEDALGLPPPDLRRVWGDPVLNKNVWSAHNPTELAGDLKNLKIFIATGTGFAGNGEDNIHSGTVENQIWTMHRSFLAALTANRIPFTARVTTGGVHDWPWFDRPLRWGLPKLIKAARGR